MEEQKVDGREAVTGMIRRALPQLNEVGRIYAVQYPPAKTAPEVLDAVTVVVPLRVYMALVAFANEELDPPPAEQDKQA